MLRLFETNKIDATIIPDAVGPKGKIDLSVIRFDKIHPVISGNKLYKLNHFLDYAVSKGIRKIITYGGAYSNHLVATAYAGKLLNLETTGIVRGEKPPVLSPTLSACEAYGMALQYVLRQEYAERTERVVKMELFPDSESLEIAEGGYHSLGVKGAASMMEQIRFYRPTHICVAIGTATTFAGLLEHTDCSMIIGVPVLKNLTDISTRLEYLGVYEKHDKRLIWDDYHFGGYAKKNDELIEFMNELYKHYSLPTDFVYTAKMMYAVFDKIKKGFFEPGSRVVCVHTGGLQGNSSLPQGSLVF